MKNRNQAETTVLGFAFSPDREGILLRQMPMSGRQAHLQGRWNGHGGPVYAGEREVETMAREFEAETGLKVSEDRWIPILRISSLLSGQTIGCYGVVLTHQEWLRVCRDPENLILNKNKVSEQNIVQDLRWIVPVTSAILRAKTLHSHDTIESIEVWNE